RGRGRLVAAESPVPQDTNLLMRERCNATGDGLPALVQGQGLKLRARTKACA
ncbi:hypothetical protein H4R99_008687, partial [Coemansia sp. RSA 1722]